MEDYIKNVIFKNKEKRYQELRELPEKIKRMSLKKKPLLIEFIGTSRSGKSSSIELIEDVLVKNGLKVLVIDEEFVKVTKEINHSRNKKINVDSLEYINNVIEEKISIYDNTAYEDYDIIIYDRGINDEFIWLSTFGASEKEIEQYDERLKERTIDILITMICSSKTALERKYLNSLSILPTKWTNKETIKKYSTGIEKTEKYWNKHSKNKIEINTDGEDKIEVALTILNKVIEIKNIDD